MLPAPTPPAAGQGPAHPPKSKITMWVGIFTGLLFIILLKIFLFPTNSNSSKNDKFEGSKEIEVEFTGKYSRPVYLPSGHNFYFEEASESYVVKNKAGEEISGNEGEDVSNQFPTLDGGANKTLWFKTRNGKDGTITIVLIKK